MEKIGRPRLWEAVSAFQRSFDLSPTPYYFPRSTLASWPFCTFLHGLKLIMTLALRFQTVTRRLGPCRSSNALRRIALPRSYSNAASTLNDTLPLSGIRVLDMTRVLAGVSTSSGLCFLGYTLILDDYSHTAPKF